MQTPIPDFTHALRCLAAILTKAEAHCAAHKIDPEALLKARLYPDMFHLIRNVQTACDAAKFTGARLSQTPAPRNEDSETTFADLQARIAATIAFLDTIPEAAFEGAEARDLPMPGRSDGPMMTGAAYLARFARPHFYFHVTTSYNILRHNGVPLSKLDFLQGAS